MTALSPEAESSILAVHDRWLQAELAGNSADVLTWCSEDVVWIPPTEPAIRGQGAVRAWLAGRPPVVLEDITVTHLEVQGAGSLGYKVADFRTRFRPASSLTGQTARGSHLWVLREEAPGAWRVVAVTWSLQLTPETAA